MATNTTRIRIVSVLLAVILSHPILAFSDPFIVGIFPRQGAMVVHKQFGALEKYLNVALGRDVVLETAKDFDTFWENVRNQRYDLVHYNQYHYVKSHKEFGYEAILRNEELGKETMSSALAISVESGITDVAQLKGKKIVFGGGRSAMVAYIGVKQLLLDAGLKDGDYAEEYSNNPPNAVLALYVGQADAAGTADSVFNVPAVAQKVQANKLRFLKVGIPLPHLPWAVKSSVDPATRAKLVDALAALDKSIDGKSILQEAGVSRFIRAKDSDYDACRDMIRSVTGETY